MTEARFRLACGSLSFALCVPCVCFALLCLACAAPSLGRASALSRLLPVSSLSDTLCVCVCVRVRVRVRIWANSDNPRFRGENIIQLELDMPERTTRDYEERDSLEVISVGVPYLCEGTLQREKRQGRAVGGEGLNGLLATTWDADRESLELLRMCMGGPYWGTLCMWPYLTCVQGRHTTCLSDRLSSHCV